MSGIFELVNVSRAFGDTAALKDITLSVGRGERIALVGPSGAGKTTLLNLLSGYLPSDRGTLLLDGLEMSTYKDRKALAEKVGMIRQQFDLVGELAVIHNVSAGHLARWGTLKSLLSLIVPQERQTALAALERMGIMDKAYQKTATLSGGQQQRVAMARLMVQAPKAILADEPVASLDPSRAEDVLSLLVSMAKDEGATLIASLHSVEYARKYFDRLIGLRGGEMVFDCSVAEVNDNMLEALYALDVTNSHEKHEVVVSHE